jgi:hypothetical protein
LSGTYTIVAVAVLQTLSISKDVMDLRLPMILALILSSCTAPATEGEHAAPEFAQLASLHNAIGSPTDWASMPRYLRFDFRIVFNDEEFLFSENLWDRWEGRYRTRWTAAFEEGERLGLINMDTGEGRVYLNGDEVTDSTKSALLSAAQYRAFNDSYWLVAPFKFGDPGSHLEAADVGSWHLTFDGETGITPGDQFWLYFSEETGLLERWAFFLEYFEGEPTLEQTSEWSWDDWGEFGGVRLATHRTLTRPSPQFPQIASGEIQFPVLKFLDEVDDRVFSDPSWPVP